MLLWPRRFVGSDRDDITTARGAGQVVSLKAAVLGHDVRPHKEFGFWRHNLTQYGEGRASTKAFLTHHVANISTVVQAVDAHTVLSWVMHAVCGVMHAVWGAYNRYPCEGSAIGRRPPPSTVE